MVEYAIISGKNIFNGFLGSIDPAIHSLRAMYAKAGLNLSVGETCFASGIIIAVAVGLLVMIFTK